MRTARYVQDGTRPNLDTGYFSEDNIVGLQEREIEPYMATGRSPHHQGWRRYFLDNPDPLPKGATVKEQMAYKLRTEIGKAVSVDPNSE